MTCEKMLGWAALLGVEQKLSYRREARPTKNRSPAVVGPSQATDSLEGYL